jgi:hypothetical protein
MIYVSPTEYRQALPMVDETIIEIFSTKMGITSGGFDFEDALLDSEKGDIECSSTEIEDQDVAFANDFLVETVGNGSGCGLVDDSKNVRP